MPLSSVERLKRALGVTAADQDQLLAEVLAGAEAAVERWCKRSFERADYAEFYSGSGTPLLTLRQRPVSAVASVHEDQSGYWGQGQNAFAATTLLAAGADYAVQLERDGEGGVGVLQRLRSSAGWPDLGRGLPGSLAGGRGPAVWRVGQGNIRVAYTAGFAFVPDDVARATDQVAAWMYLSRDKVGILTSETLGDYAYTVGLRQGAPEIGEARSILARYREVAA